MDAVVKEQKLKEIAAEQAKGLKTEEDVGRLSAELTNGKESGHPLFGEREESGGLFPGRTTVTN